MDMCLSACVYTYVCVHAGGGQTIRLFLPSLICNTHSGVITQVFSTFVCFEYFCNKRYKSFIGFVSL